MRAVDAEELWNRSPKASRKKLLIRLGIGPSVRLLGYSRRYKEMADLPWRLLPSYVRAPIQKLAAARERLEMDPRPRAYITGDVRGALRIPGFRSWLTRQVQGGSVVSPYAVGATIAKRASPAGLRRLVARFRGRRSLDPRALKIGVGKIGGQPHGYLGRHVLDLGDRHAHAIVDVPWESLKVKLNGLKAKFDPWRRAFKGQRARLLAIRNPKPTDAGDRAIVEAAVHVSRPVYNSLRRSGEFDVLDDGVLARRGRKKKATNIFVMPP